MGPLAFLPGEQSGLMDGPFPGAATSGVAAAFLADGKRCLHKGVDPANTLQDLFSLRTGCGRTCHMDSIYTYQINVNKKSRARKKTFQGKVNSWKTLIPRPSIVRKKTLVSAGQPRIAS